MATEAKKKREKRYYMKKRAEGRCVKCGKVDERTTGGGARCAECNAKAHENRKPHTRSEEQRQRENADKRDWAKLRLDHQLCVDCGKKDARTLSGKRQCLQCAKKCADRQKETWDYAHEKELRDARRERWIAAGLCSKCGHPKEEPERALCIDCRVKARLRKKRNKIKNGWKPRGYGGKCYQCNRAVAMAGKKLCPACYEKKIETLRAVAARRNGSQARTVSTMHD